MQKVSEIIFSENDLRHRVLKSPRPPLLKAGVDQGKAEYQPEQNGRTQTAHHDQQRPESNTGPVADLVKERRLDLLETTEGRQSCNTAQDETAPQEDSREPQGQFRPDENNDSDQDLEPGTEDADWQALLAQIDGIEQGDNPAREHNTAKGHDSHGSEKVGNDNGGNPQQYRQEGKESRLVHSLLPTGRLF